MILRCGDFNYRIDMGRDDVEGLVAKGDWPALLSADQVRSCILHISHSQTLHTTGWFSTPWIFILLLLK